MVLCILFLTFWDIIWVSFTDIGEDIFSGKTTSKNFLAQDLNHFDNIMFQGETIFSWVVYYMIIISGPIDLCRMYMLTENKRIYALLICFTGGIKLGMQGLFFNELIKWILG